MSKRVERIKIGDKEYSLNDIWRLCLRMWKDIKNKLCIDSAKEKWLEEHGFDLGGVNCTCFFCEWNTQHENGACTHCPGKLVSKSFSCCRDNYHYFYASEKFYSKLLRLNKKRKNQ